MSKKKCTKCLVIKSIEDFYVDRSKVDGHTYNCKKCLTEYMKGRVTEESLAKARARSRKRSRRLYKMYGRVYPDRTKKQRIIRYKQKSPEKYHAQRRAEQKIKLEFKGAQRHHWSYNEEHHYDVIQITKAHHAKAHRFIVYDKERKMFRKLSGEILDTKERHRKYIEEMISTMPD